MTKLKTPLFALLIVALLAAALAVPVFAEEGDIPMYLQRVRLAYTGRSSTSPDSMVGYVHVRDTNLTMVAGAQVTAKWITPKGVEVIQTAESKFQGIAEFRLWAGAGDYQFCVLDITKAGWQYDPALNRETCTTFILPPY
jgi:hypothetical protein